MNIRDLQYLIAVAEHRHFGKAAEISHVSQPTLSMQLKKLEEYLGVTIFERTNRKVMVTPIGEEIIQHARTILQETDAIRQASKAAQDPLAGDFRLGAFPTLAPYYLPHIIPPLHQALPKLRLLLIEEKTEKLVEKLRDGTLDAALLALPIDDEGLETVPMFEDPFLLAVPHDHPLATRQHVSHQDLRREKLLLLEEGHCLRQQALDVCNLIGTSEQEEFRATSLETLRQMVAANVGITLIPNIAVQQNNLIRYIPFDAPPSRTIGLMWRKHSARKVCIQSIVKELKKIRS